MKISDLLKREIQPFLYGAFFSRIMSEKQGTKNYFFCYTAFKASRLVPEIIFDIKNYSNELINSLNFYSGFNNWKIHRVTATKLEARFYIENDLSLTETSFFNMLYSKFLQCRWIRDTNLTEEKKSFVRGFLELRGSVDTTAKYITQDYFYNNRIELKKAQIFTDFMNVPINYANFNMRDLQPQFVYGINRRNAQFRMNSYFYAKYIGFINDYKATIFEKAYPTLARYKTNRITYFDLNMPNSRNDDVIFIKYLNFFSNNVYEKMLTLKSVDELRKRLGFNNSASSNEETRNKTIIGLFDMIAPDKCAICGTEHTYEKNDGRQYFEIHHVISRCNGPDTDNIANLVKLCPNCHRMMKKNASPKDKQIKAIIKILNEHNEIFEFCSSYLNINEINELANKIWNLLG